MRIPSTRTCACGCDYDAETWAGLPLSARLGGEQVSSLVTQWPRHLVVEVRICVRCKRQMARLQHALHAETTKEQAIAA